LDTAASTSTNTNTCTYWC